MWTFDATPLGRVLLEQVSNAYPTTPEAPESVRAIWYALDQAALVVPEYSGLVVPGITGDAYYESSLARFHAPYQSDSATNLLERSLEIAREAAAVVTTDHGAFEEETALAVVGRSLTSYLLVFRVRDLIEDALSSVFGTRGAPEVSAHLDYLIDNGGKDVNTDDIFSYISAQFPSVSRDDDRAKQASDRIVRTLVPLIP